MNVASISQNGSAGITISDWKPIGKNTLVGVFTLHLPSGMLVHGVMLHEHQNGQRWIGMPAREYVLNGEKKYARIIEFDARTTQDRFNALVLAALDAAKVAA